MDNTHHILIHNEKDIITARKLVRSIAGDLGFNNIDQTRITTAISELARNVVKYAGTGSMTIEVINDHRVGLLVITNDEGPGIKNISKAMEDGFTTSNSLGAGLPGVRRLMDEFSIDSIVHSGTRIRVVKWLKT